KYQNPANTTQTATAIAGQGRFLVDTGSISAVAGSSIGSTAGSSFTSGVSSAGSGAKIWASATGSKALNSSPEVRAENVNLPSFLESVPKFSSITSPSRFRSK